MSLFIIICLGLVQGLTEFIPVSSSGHLEIAQYLLNAGGRAEDFHYFLELINFGTLLALLIYYRRDLLRLLKDIFVRHDFSLALKLLITSVPAGLIGLLLSHFIESQPFFSSIFTIATAMGLVGLLMIFIDRLPRLSTVKDITSLSRPRALIIGLAQTFALTPGVSRSGSTIITGRLVGLNNQHAAKYSFLASIPIMLAVCGKSLLSSSTRAYISENLFALVIGNLVAFVSGLIALRFVMKFFAKKNSLQAFGYYRVILACLVLAFSLLVW